jgi:hypothetical protein
MTETDLPKALEARTSSLGNSENHGAGHTGPGWLLPVLTGIAGPATKLRGVK